MKCTIAGVCIEYSVRKKRERKATKANLMKNIERANAHLVGNPSDESLISQLEKLQAELNKILDFETRGAYYSFKNEMDGGRRAKLKIFL